jgi:hypothetical protein
MNSSDNSQDLGLSTLLQVRNELGLSLPDELVKEIYAIQKKHQFEQDRTLSHQATERLIDETLDQSN